MARHYPDCGHVRPKGDRHRRCVTCLGRDHAEGALSGKAPVCSICASLPLAKATRRLAFWKRKDAEETALVPSGADAPVRMSASSALDLVSVSSRPAAAAPLPGLSPSPPPISLLCSLGAWWVELQTTLTMSVRKGLSLYPMNLQDYVVFLFRGLVIIRKYSIYLLTHKHK